MSARPTPPRLPARVQGYLDAIVESCAKRDGALVSVILFGSVAKGGFSGTISDVDLILVLPTGATREDRRRLGQSVRELEARHRMLEPTAVSRSVLGWLFERVTATNHTFFMCTRADLLSGSPARILGVSAAQGAFVDRVVIPSIITSAVTVWGEELLARVPLPPIRRLDVFKSFFGLFPQLLTSAALFPVLPGATRYAMGALKRSVHHCFFCYHARPEALAEEVKFFQGKIGSNHALEELLSLRQDYRESFGFVARSIPAMARLHLRTARENRFPRVLRAEPDG